MNIKHYVDLNEVVKIANAIISSDLVNFEWDYINKDKGVKPRGRPKKGTISSQIIETAAWIYFIVVDGIIRKVGGTGMKLENRLAFYANANHWSNKPGYCNAATNPIVFKYLQEGKKVELYAIRESITPIYVEKTIGGAVKRVLANIDFRPFEKEYREDIKLYNLKNNIVNEDLNLDGKSLQNLLNILGLKEVNDKVNKRVQAGIKWVKQGKKWIEQKIKI